jgi:hypothetical protein
MLRGAKVNYRGRCVYERQVHLVVVVDYRCDDQSTSDSVGSHKRTANPLMVLLAWYEEIA